MSINASAGYVYYQGAMVVGFALFFILLMFLMLALWLALSTLEGPELPEGEEDENTV